MDVADKSTRLRVLHAGLDWCYWGRLEPTCLDDPRRSQIAGGETAMLRAAFETAGRGHAGVNHDVHHDVHVVTWCVPGKHRGVTFHNNTSFFELALEAGPWDAVVVWGDPDVLAALSSTGALDGTLRVCAQQCNGFTRNDGVQGYVDRYVSPSRTHADMLARRYGIPADRFWVIPNAVEPARYDLSRPRDPYAVYHASSPDRGLHHLLELWPEIRKSEPRATLDVYYEMQRFVDTVLGRDGPRYSHPIMLDLVQRLLDAQRRVFNGHGVTFHGGQPQQVVADRATTAGVMCYPCDPVVFTEGYGTAVLEAHVAGAVPVTTDADAFGEVYGDLFPLIPRGELREQLVPRTLEAIEIAVKERERGMVGHNLNTVADARERAREHSWQRVGERWCDLLERGVTHRRWQMTAGTAGATEARDGLVVAVR